MYLPIGDSRNSTGTIATDKLFTGQRLDTTGLYYYYARYYDPEIGRFISADSIVPNPANPQSLNRYSYCLNNPLKYTDPSGHGTEDLPDPYKDGTLGWSVDDGWVIGSGGKWLPISDSKADRISSGYRDSDYGTWSDYITGEGILETLTWRWNDPAAAGAFALAAGLLADDIPSFGLGIPDDIVAAGAALAGLGIIIWANWDYIGDTVGDVLTVFSSKSLGKPTKEDGYEPPRNWSGQKVKNPNGPGSGYPDKHGNVWVPNDHAGTHAPHWDVEHTGGGYTPVYPK